MSAEGSSTTTKINKHVNNAGIPSLYESGLKMKRKYRGTKNEKARFNLQNFDRDYGLKDFFFSFDKSKLHGR